MLPNSSAGSLCEILVLQYHQNSFDRSDIFLTALEKFVEFWQVFAPAASICSLGIFYYIDTLCSHTFSLKIPISVLKFHEKEQLLKSRMILYQMRLSTQKVPLVILRFLMKHFDSSNKFIHISWVDNPRFTTWLLAYSWSIKTSHSEHLWHKLQLVKTLPKFKVKYVHDSGWDYCYVLSVMLGQNNNAWTINHSSESLEL